MKKAIALINPILMYTKYLLLALVLMLGMVLLGQFLLGNLSMDASISGNIKQTIVPFIGAAVVSMLAVKALKR